ncbi:hypothetical protein [Pseudomonas congelans]|uniref:hypothetical protein n=1 Tax=Pseudomonas congelans TaxID=200452 RepID=UPI000BB64C02|nr:hypothetical protein [Pseudomonas congelans]PBQ00248.1 hypothetical protein CCL24_03005 [Pseudomonas congelans]
MNLTALLPTAFALALLNPAYAGSAPPASNLKNNTQQAGHSAQMVMKGTAKHQAGTYENPLQLTDDSSAAGLIYALIDSTGRRRFYESRFVGAPAEHKLPPLPDGYSDFPTYSIPAVQNESWVYRGTHAGTYADPKIACEATYMGAINKVTETNGWLAFYSTRREENGRTCITSGLPATPGSNTDWAYIGSTHTPGTFEAPKGDQTVADLTWKGAVHLFKMSNGAEAFYSSKQDGNVSPAWTAPDSQKREDNDYWKYIADRADDAHAGTYEDPKHFNERSHAVGSIYATLDSTGRRRFYSSSFIGYPADRELGFPPLPDGYEDFSRTTIPAVKNEFWVYRGTHAGTYADPKIACEATYLGAINKVTQTDGVSAFYSTLLEEDGRTCINGGSHTIPFSDSDWRLLASTDTPGTFDRPKGDQTVADFTWKGAIHLFNMANGAEAFYASKQEGTVSAAWTAPAPETREDTAYWAYVTDRNKGVHAGTYEDPKPIDERSNSVDSIYATLDSTGQRRFYSSRFIGYPADRELGFPPLPDDYDDFSKTTLPAVKNDFWVYRGVHKGTYADPKINCEATYLGAINRIEINPVQSGKERYAFFRTDYEGYGDTCWTPLPSGPASEEGWTYLASAFHLGTSSDPKGDETIADFTWRGAIHLFNMANGAEALYASKQEGTVSPAWTAPRAHTREDTAHWKYIAERNMGVHDGSYDDPKHIDERSDNTETIYATLDSTGQRRLYSSRFIGYPADQEHVFPPLPDDYEDFPSTPTQAIKNDLWIYRGVHAGTYADPKINCEATYRGAINRIEINPDQSGKETYAFFKTDEESDGVTCNKPLPTGTASEEGWTYLAGTAHLGTYSDPKGDETIADFTWKGAIHVFRMAQGLDAHYTPQQDGTVSTTWTRPDPLYRDDTEYWKYVNNRTKATFEYPAQGLDPRNLSWIGAVYNFPIDGQPTYFISRFEGLNSAVNPTAPETAESNEFFSYVGPIDQSLGTLEHPKGWHDPTWPGQIHAFNLPDRKVYYEAHFEGFPSERYDSVDDIKADTVNWAYRGESRHRGTYADPKTLEDLTWPGAVHKRDGYFDGSNPLSVYYRSTFLGTAVTLGIDYPQDGLHSDKQWTYLGVSQRAGTFQSPKGDIEVTWPGAVHASLTSGYQAENFFVSKVEGMDYGRPFPPKGQDSEAWKYIGTREHQGTFTNPNTEHNFTWPGAIHMVEERGRLRFLSSTFWGVPPSQQGWEYPKGNTSNEDWTHIGIGLHRGTYGDPKPWDDMTWPGAIHDHFSKAGHLYFIARKQGVPSRMGWGYPSEAVNNEHWLFARTEKYQGTFDEPKEADDDVTRVGAIHRTVAGTGASLYFSSLMQGLPADLGASVPHSAQSTKFFSFIAMSKHEGTEKDPKDWDDLTWKGRIHRYEHADDVFLFAAKATGVPSEKHWYYPTTGISNDHWTFIAESKNPGTYGAPKDWEDITWPGAIHAYSGDGVRRFYAARGNGTPSKENWTYPVGATDNQYWTYLASQKHQGTYADPKELDEPTWPGVIHMSQVENVRNYYKSRNDGIPSQQGWVYPEGAVSNNNWIYIASATHAGTAADPKSLSEPTWPGQVHLHRDQAGTYFYYTSITEGLPSEDGWNYPAGEASNEHWTYRGTGRHSGMAYDAKDWDEFTWPGALHFSTVNNLRVLFASKNEGVPSQHAWHYPLAASDDANWTFAGGSHAGTFIDPRDWTEPTSPGAQHVILRDRIPYFYTAKFTGTAPAHNWYFPVGEVDNDHWTYAGKHYGTFDSPRTSTEQVWPGAITLLANAGVQHYYEARKDGKPADAGWPLPADNSSNEYWIDKGIHAGTLADPKDWDEVTWPGAIHRYIQPDRTYFYTAQVAGLPSAHYWYYPSGSTSNAWWTLFADWEQTAPGINDVSRPFNQYTWATAHNAYLNSIKEQLERGIRGFMLDLYPRTRDDGTPFIKLCHGWDEDVCYEENSLNDELAKTLNDVYLPFLKANPSAVITLMLESYVERKLFERELKQVSPEFLSMVFDTADYSTARWPLLVDMIRKNKRVIILANKTELTGKLEINGLDVRILKNTDIAVENTYNLGLVTNHDWTCETRDMGHPLETVQAPSSKGWPPLFVMNQIHSFASSAAHAGDVDNNLTWLQRRVLDNCMPKANKYPNYIAVDYNQTGDTIPYAAALSQGGIYLYEKANADRSGDTVCVLPSLHDYSFRLPAHGCENDEVRSVQLAGVARGTRITLYDSPDGKKSDDFVYIDVKKTMPINAFVTIHSLERSFSNDQVTVTALRNNGIDGKVSRIVVGASPADSDFSGAEIVFHEGNGATENTVCTVPFAKHDQFKMGAGNNPYGCDNDEIKSATIVRAKKGSQFSLTGNPDGTFDQGITYVTIMQDIIVPHVIPSFNEAYNDGFIKVRVTDWGSMDGKSSYGYFQPLQ